MENAQCNVDTPPRATGESWECKNDAVGIAVADIINDMQKINRHSGIRPAPLLAMSTIGRCCRHGQTGMWPSGSNSDVGIGVSVTLVVLDAARNAWHLQERRVPCCFFHQCCAKSRYVACWSCWCDCCGVSCVGSTPSAGDNDPGLPALLSGWENWEEAVLASFRLLIMVASRCLRCSVGMLTALLSM